MIWALALAMGTVITVGVYLAFSRDLLRCLVGLALLGNGINLLLFGGGRFGSTAPPVIEKSRGALAVAANPLPQALVLTAIVIGFALLCFSLVLALGILAKGGSMDVEELRSAEPPSADPLKPELEERP